MGDDTDAFGRKKDEAGLGDLGWGATGQAPPPQQPPPTVSSTPQQPFQQMVTPQTTGLGSSRRNPVLILVQLVIVAAVAAGVYVVTTSGGDDPITRAINPVPESARHNGSGSGTTDPGDKKVPEQVKSRDYFSAAGLRAGLKILEKEQPGRISNFSFRRDRIDIQVVRGGKTHIVELTEDAEAPQEFSASEAISSETFSYEKLNPGAPERLMKAANARLSKSKADVDYFVANQFSGLITWGVYYKGGRPIAQGDSQGRYTRRIS